MTPYVVSCGESKKSTEDLAVGQAIKVTTKVLTKSGLGIRLSTGIV
jgi:hypothetical protein